MMTLTNRMIVEWSREHKGYLCVLSRGWKVRCVFIRTTDEVIDLADVCELPIISRCAGDKIFSGVFDLDLKGAS